MDFMEVINKRRSTRDFLPREVPDDVIKKILQAGRLSPSGGNAQNYYFGIVKDRRRKKELARAAGQQSWIASAPVIIALCAHLGPDPAQLPDDDFGLHVNRTRFGRQLIDYFNEFPDRRAIKIYWNNSSPLLAGEHILLAAVNYGLQGCWIGYLDIDEASKVLQLPSDVVCLFLLPIGYGKSCSERPEKKELAELVFQEKWDK